LQTILASIIITGNNDNAVTNNINTSIDELTQWFAENSLSLNVEKTVNKIS